MTKPAHPGRPILSVLTLVLLAPALGVVTAAPAHAAPPRNDDIATPTRITGVPATISQDTSQATGNRSDGACAQGASVWYRFRPTSTATLRVVTIGSDYDTRLAVWSGTRANRSILACNDDATDDLASAVRVRFVQGRTYWIVLGACCSRSARGGNSILNIYRGRAAGVDATIDSVESGGISGRLLLAGRVTCRTPSSVSLFAEASQRVGEAVARGFGSEFITCSPREESTFRPRVDSETGWAFQPGSVVLALESDAFDAFDFAIDTVEATMPVIDDPDGRAGHRERR